MTNSSTACFVHNHIKRKAPANPARNLLASWLRSCTRTDPNRFRQLSSHIPRIGDESLTRALDRSTAKAQSTAKQTRTS